MTHGLYGYNQGCRCAECRAARKAWFSAWAPTRLAAVTEHDARTYRLGCRCEQCRSAKAAAKRAGRVRG